MVKAKGGKFYPNLYCNPWSVALFYTSVHFCRVILLSDLDNSALLLFLAEEKPFLVNIWSISSPPREGQEQRFLIKDDY